MGKLFTEETAQAMLDEIKAKNTHLAQLTSEVTKTGDELVKLSSEVSDFSEELSAAKTDFTNAKNSLSKEVSTAKTDISTNKSNITALQSDVSTAKKDISTNKSNITTLQSDVSTAKKDISTNKSNITTLQGRTDILTYNAAAAHNAFYRGKNLGTTVTEAQHAAIKNGTFEDIYPGDYWVFNNEKFYVFGCNSLKYRTKNTGQNHVVLGFRSEKAFTYTDPDTGTKTTFYMWGAYNGVFQFMETQTNANGLIGTSFYTHALPAALEYVAGLVGGEDKLVTARVLTSDHATDGVNDHFVWKEDKIFILSLDCVWGYKTGRSAYKNLTVQFPIIQHFGEAPYPNYLLDASYEGIHKTSWTIMEGSKIYTAYASGTELGYCAWLYVLLQ